MDYFSQQAIRFEQFPKNNRKIIVCKLINGSQHLLNIKITGIYSKQDDAVLLYIPVLLTTI